MYKDNRCILYNKFCFNIIILFIVIMHLVLIYIIPIKWKLLYGNFNSGLTLLFYQKHINSKSKMKNYTNYKNILIKQN